MHHGMTYEQFWYGELDILNMFMKKAEIDYNSKKLQYNDNQAWLNGKYILEAIATVMKKKGSSIKYPEKPYEYEERNNNGEVLTDAEKLYRQMKSVAHNVNIKRKLKQDKSK